MVRDAQSGKYRRTRLFVLTLGYSRKSVRLLTWRSSVRTWAELHEKAFRRLGGCPKVVVLDNLKEGVAVPDLYDPAVNPLFRDVLAHYGAVAMPCRIQDPDRKGKVESGIGHTKRTALKGMRFESLEEAQAYLDRWEERWANTRIHGTTKRQVAAMFLEEKPHLQPLPLEPFRYYQYGERVVHLDGCVEVEGPLLQLAARMDRAFRESAMGRAARAHPPSPHQSASSRTSASEARRVSHPGRRPPKENAVEHRAALATRCTCRHPDWEVLPAAVRPARRDQHPLHPGCAFPDE